MNLDVQMCQPWNVGNRQGHWNYEILQLLHFSHYYGFNTIAADFNKKIVSSSNGSKVTKNAVPCFRAQLKVLRKG